MDQIQRLLGTLLCQWIGLPGTGNPGCGRSEHNLFISWSAIPHGHTIMYGCIVIDYHPQKLEPNWTWLTIGEDHIDYPWEVATPTANLMMAKLLFNSSISTPGAKFFGSDGTKFLSPYTPWLTWIHVTPTGSHPRGNQPQIHLAQHCREQMGLHWNIKGNVQIATIGTVGQ